MDVVVITGAARGMGLACAARLADRRGDGMRLVLVDVDEAALGKAAAELGAVAVVCDITKRVEVAELAARVAKLGAFRGLVHSAGVSPTMGDWRRIWDVDLRGSALLLEAFRPLAVEGSAAVCFSSLAAYLLAATGDPKLDAVLDAPLVDDFLDRLAELGDARVTEPTTAYAWAKRGVQRLVQREAVSWGRMRARVNSISPGMIETAMMAQELAVQPMMAVMLERTPLGRAGLPNEVAALVTFLLSGEASFITGIDVLIDGGVLQGVRR